MTALILNLSPTIELTDEQFFQLCINNRDLRLEQTAEAELIIMHQLAGKVETVIAG